MKILFLILLSFSFYFLSANEALEQLLNEAMEANPEISAIEYQIKALREKEIFVQKLMDPMLAIEYSNVPANSWRLDESPMSGIQFKLMQTIPFPGKNSRRKAVVQSEGQIQKYELEELKLQLKGKIKKVYFQLGYTRELKQISQKHIELLEELIETIYFKYETGKVNQADLLRMTLMKDKLLDELEDFDLKEKELQAVLNSVLNRDLYTFINTTSIEKNLFIEFNFEELLEVSKQKRPLLKKIKESSKMKRLTLDQVKWERLSDITLWTGYRYRQDTEMMTNNDFVSIGFSFPLPFDFKGRTKAKINNAEFMENASEENYQNVLNNISEMLLTTISELERTSSKINNYKDKLIPDAEKTLSSILSSYKTGRANFTDLYQAQLQLIQFEKILIKSKYQYAIYESTIEILSGENLMEN